MAVAVASTTKSSRVPGGVRVPCPTYPPVMGRADATIALPVRAIASRPRRPSLTRPLTGARPPAGRYGALARHDSRSGRPSVRTHPLRARTRTIPGCVAQNSSRLCRRRRDRAVGLVACAGGAIWVPLHRVPLRRATGDGPARFRATAHRVRFLLRPPETLLLTLCDDQRVGRPRPPLRWAVVSLSYCPARAALLPPLRLLLRPTPLTPPTLRARIRLAPLSRSRSIPGVKTNLLIVAPLQARGRHRPRA